MCVPKILFDEKEIDEEQDEKIQTKIEKFLETPTNLLETVVGNGNRVLNIVNGPLVQRRRKGRRASTFVVVVVVIITVIIIIIIIVVIIH